jgi:hypothetical protein
MQNFFHLSAGTYSSDSCNEDEGNICFVTRTDLIHCWISGRELLAVLSCPHLASGAILL